MIKWTQIQEQPPPDGVYALVTDGRMWEKARRYRGAWRDWGHRQQPTHWAPINMPGETVLTCDTCNPGTMGLACHGCKDHDKLEAATNAKN